MFFLWLIASLYQVFFFSVNFRQSVFFVVNYCPSVLSLFSSWIFVSLSEVFFSDLELCRYDSESGSAKLLNTDAIWIRIPITDYNRILDFLSPKKAPLRNAVKNHASIVLFFSLILWHCLSSIKYEAFMNDLLVLQAPVYYLHKRVPIIIIASLFSFILSANLLLACFSYIIIPIYIHILCDC